MDSGGCPFFLGRRWVRLMIERLQLPIFAKISCRCSFLTHKVNLGCVKRICIFVNSILGCKNKGL